jgi:hypothetical protein
MGREVKKAEEITTEKRSVAKSNAKSSKSRQNANTKRGWSDVFDNLTYSDGPGDNIYVFG